MAQPAERLAGVLQGGPDHLGRSLGAQPRTTASKTMTSPRPSPDRAKTPQAAGRGGLVSQRTGIVQWKPLANRAGSGPWTVFV